MLLFIASVAAGVVDPYCQAPHVYAAPIDNMTLAYAQVLVRHGQRTPISQNLNTSDKVEWHCNELGLPGARTVSAPSRRYRFYHRKLDQRNLEYPPSCRAGDLTVGGMLQHVDLGNMYRKYLVSDLRFLPEDLDPSFIRIVTSPVDRCLRSAESFVAGLYPPVDPNEVLAIESGPQGLSDIVVSGKFCQEVEDANSAFDHSEMATEFAEKHLPTFEAAFKIVNRTGKTFGDYAALCGTLLAINCSDAMNPTWMSDAMMDVCIDAMAMDQYGRYASNRYVFGSYTLRKMLSAADEHFGNRDSKKFVLFSAHDTSVAAVNVALGLVADEMPPYTSHVLAEYWRDWKNELWIRWVFNGEPMKMDLLENATVVKLDAFRSVIDPLIDHCNDYDL